MASQRTVKDEAPSRYRCAACNRPVDEVIVGRRKVMGAWTPVWGPGLCHDPKCAGSKTTTETTTEPDRE